MSFFANNPSVAMRCVAEWLCGSQVKCLGNKHQVRVAFISEVPPPARDVKTSTEIHLDIFGPDRLFLWKNDSLSGLLS